MMLVPLERNPEPPDTDVKGQELGVVAPGPATDMTKFKPDRDPTTRTNPLDPDTDDDGMRAAERTQRAGESPAWPETRLGL